MIKGNKVFYVYYGWKGWESSYPIAQESEDMASVLRRINKQSIIKWRDGLRQYAWLLHVGKESERRLVGIYDNFESRRLYLECRDCDLLQAHPPVHTTEAVCLWCKQPLNLEKVTGIDSTEEQIDNDRRIEREMTLYFNGRRIKLESKYRREATCEAIWNLDQYMDACPVRTLGFLTCESTYGGHKLINIIHSNGPYGLVCPVCKTEYPYAPDLYNERGKCPWCGEPWAATCPIGETLMSHWRGQ